MKRKINLSRSVLLNAFIIILTIFTACPLGFAVTYTITDLGTLGGSISRAFGINENGQVAGYSKLSNTMEHGFLWSSGVMDYLGVLHSGYHRNYPARAFGLNDSGWVVGRSFAEIGVNQATLWYSAFDMVNLGTFAEENVGTSEANDINNNGKVVGWAWTGTTHEGEYTYHAFFWEDGEGKTDLGTFGGAHSYAQAINDLDKVVGWAYTSTDEVRSFIWDEVSGMVEIPNALGGTSSQAYDINDSNWVVGYARDSSNQIIPYLWKSDTGMIDLGLDVGLAKAVNNKGWVVGDKFTYDPFIWKNGSAVYLNDLLPEDSGWVLATAEDINEDGQIVGYGTFNGLSHAYLLTPSGGDEGGLIPEPASLLLLGFGVVGIAIFKRRLS